MYPQTQFDILPHLHNQHQYYTAELARTHQGLSKLYRKLAKIEKTLAEREERGLTRKEKKKLQWAKSVTKSTVQKMEVHQGGLQDYLRQCNDLIASYQAASPIHTSPSTPGWYLPSTPWTAHLPASPWTGHMPPTPWTGFSPYSPIAPNPWYGCARPHGPQYWDLSMLRERRQSSPYTSGSSADSGFYEPALYGHPIGSEESVVDLDHVYAHEMMTPAGYGASTEEPPVTRSKQSSVSEKDDVPELPTSPLASPAKVGATESSTPTSSSHRRRFSENAIQIIENRLSSPKIQQRGTSVGPVPAAARKATHVEDADRAVTTAAE